MFGGNEALDVNILLCHEGSHLIWHFYPIFFDDNIIMKYVFKILRCNKNDSNGSSFGFKMLIQFTLYSWTMIQISTVTLLIFHVTICA